MFYSAKEAADRLGTTEEKLKTLVREGKLREFRDAGTVNYKVADLDALAPDGLDTNTEDSTSASASGDIMLEPVEDSSIELATSADDVISLDGSAAGGTASGTTATGKLKEDTVVPSVGVNVFDDDELDEQVDPLAQTAITDVAGLGMEGVGTGSGILELARGESDDTSLGKELLDEIYPGEGSAGDEGAVEMGDDTRAGLAVVPDEGTEEERGIEVEAEPAAHAPQATLTRAVEYGPDAVSTSLTALLVVALAVMWFAGLGAAALVRGITPALLDAIYTNLWIYASAAVVAVGAAGAVTFLVVKKRSG